MSSEVDGDDAVPLAELRDVVGPLVGVRTPSVDEQQHRAVAGVVLGTCVICAVCVICVEQPHAVDIGECHERPSYEDFPPGKLP